MEINELNREVRALLRKEIFWTGFKRDQIIPKTNETVFSQIGWFGTDRNGWARLDLTLAETDTAEPSDIADKITLLWMERMNLVSPTERVCSVQGEA